MKRVCPIRSIVNACLAAALLAGCGGSVPPIGGSGAMPQSTWLPARPNGPKSAGWLLPEAKTQPLIYVADQSANAVLIYPAKGRLKSAIGAISTGVESPYGLFVDRQNNLYVANQGNNTVSVYPPGSTSPSYLYSSHLRRPLYPLVDGSGDLFVSNGDNGSVVEYKPQSNEVSRILQTGGNEADGMDLDRQGNLYVAYRYNAGKSASIMKFGPGSTTRGQSLGMTLNQPQGVIVDDDGNIVVVETGLTNRVDVFPPDSRNPLLVVHVPLYPIQLALRNRQRERGLVISFLGIGASGTLYTVRYPFQSQPRLVKKEKVQYHEIQGVALSHGQAF